MQQIHTSLVHKVLSPRKKTTGKHPTLVLLHGRGANEDDLLGLSEYLDERLLIVSARAPFEFQYGGGYTWYDIMEVGRPEPKMFAESYQKLVQFLSDIQNGYPIDSMRIMLGGFSMGTIMSYALALTRPADVFGVVANSGYVPEETDLEFDWNSIRNKPFFVAHGKFDPVIPVSFAQRAKELLDRAQASTTYREYDMGHQISEESLNDMMAWLSKHLGGTKK